MLFSHDMSTKMLSSRDPDAFEEPGHCSEWNGVACSELQAQDPLVYERLQTLEYISDSSFLASPSLGKDFTLGFSLR